MESIVIIGGDNRQQELYKIFTQMGYSVRYINSDFDFNSERCIRKKDIIILPIPVSKDTEYIYSLNSGFKVKIIDVLNRIDSSNFIFGGNIAKVTKAYLSERKISYFDYLECDELTVYNAYLTGLGAMKLLLERTDEDLCNKKVLITGYGRVARFTAQAFLKAGCDVYVTARKSLQLAEAECSGCKVIELDKMSSFLYLFDYILNTVPENIFSYENVNHIKGKYIELASSPFGVRKEYFAGREDKYIFGGSLPGRYLPYSAAEKLTEITLKHINSRNEGD